MSEAFEPKGCDAVTNHISQAIPETLWHYTSFQGLYGIITSKKIWATEYRFLNDKEEFLHAKDLTLKLLDEEPELTGMAFPARDIARQLVNTALNASHLREDRMRLMVASFTQEGDLLSQWRGYAGNSTGVSIGLDLRGLRPPSHIHTSVTFAPCLYQEADKRSILKAVIAFYLKGIQEWWDKTVKLGLDEQSKIGGKDVGSAWKIVQAQSGEQRKVIDRCLANLQFDLLRIAPLLKNGSFSEEREWRLVLPLEPNRTPTVNPIQFRSIFNALVPYIAYPLKPRANETCVPCTNLILGPGSHDASEFGMNLFLQEQGILVRAERSKIPYRPN